VRHAASARRLGSDAKKIVEERKLDHVKVGVFDNDGIMRGKYMAATSFSPRRHGFGWCVVWAGTPTISSTTM
jgi:glutamine synthetase